MASYFLLVWGNLITKFIVISFHFYSSSSHGDNSPRPLVLHFNLLACQVVRRLAERCIFVPPGCIENLELCKLVSTLFKSSLLLGIQILPRYLTQPSVFTLNGLFSWVAHSTSDTYHHFIGLYKFDLSTHHLPLYYTLYWFLLAWMPICKLGYHGPHIQYRHSYMSLCAQGIRYYIHFTQVVFHLKLIIN